MLDKNREISPFTWKHPHIVKQSGFRPQIF